MRGFLLGLGTLGLVACVGDTASTSPPTNGTDAGGQGDASVDSSSAADAGGGDTSVSDAGPPPCVIASGTSGSLEPTFKAGTTTLSANGTTIFKAHGSLVRNGSLYVYGVSAGCGSTGRSQQAVAHFASSGDLDTAFGVGGVACPVLPGNNEPWAGAQDPVTGRIVVVGGSDAGGGGVALSCLKADGTADTSCLGGNGGLVMVKPLTGAPSTQFGAGANGLGVAFDSKGRILVVGGDGNPFSAATWGFVMRLDPTTGMLDPTFNGGKILYQAGVTGFGAVVADGDAMFVSGASAAGAWQTYRFDATGALDKKWALGGGFNSYPTDTPAKEDIPRRMVRDLKNNALVLGGYANQHPGANVVGAPSGALISKYSAPTGVWNYGYVLDGVAAQCDGKVLLGSWADANTAGSALTRFDSLTGKVDTTFAGSGTIKAIAGNTADAFVSVAFDDKSGTILATLNHANTGVSIYRIIP